MSINRGNAIFNNIKVSDCHFGDRHLFQIKKSSKFEFNHGSFQNNFGNECLFHVGENASLVLNMTMFSNNCILCEEQQQSCISTEKKANVQINNCEFLNHTSSDFPFSACIIRVDGDLTILSSKFENNKIEVGIWPCIEVNYNIISNKTENLFFSVRKEISILTMLNLEIALILDSAIVQRPISKIAYL